MDRTMSLPETTIQRNKEEAEAAITFERLCGMVRTIFCCCMDHSYQNDEDLDEHNPYESRGTRISPKMKRRMGEHASFRDKDLDKCNPWELQGTRISPEMKQKMVEHFGYGSLPRLTNTKATDRTAQAILDLDTDVRRRGRANVDWSNLALEDTSIGDVGIEALARAFVQTTTQNPELRLVRVKALDDETAVELANALNANPSWVELRICDWGSSELKALAGALSHNHVWQSLVLGTNLQDEAIRTLAEALQQNSHWKTFSFWRVLVSSMNGVKALCGALSENKTWKSFQLEGSLLDKPALIDDCELEALSYALRCNQCWETFRYRCPSHFDFDGGLGSVAHSLHGECLIWIWTRQNMSR